MKESVSINPDFHHSFALWRQFGKAQFLPLALAVNEQMHQSTDSCGVKRGDGCHFQDEMKGGLRPHQLEELVNGLQTQHYAQVHDGNFIIRDGLLDDFEPDAFHRERRVQDGMYLLCQESITDCGKAEPSLVSATFFGH